jgi:multiple sugar transport system ATP-binding protein
LAELSFEGVGKTYPDGTRAVGDLTLSIADREFVVLVGPSGCGKTTALRMVAGLEEITDGVIRIGGEIANYLAPRDRDVAMVFQNYALYPQMTVFENMAFGLRLRKVPKEQRRERVEQIAHMIGLEDMLDRKPANLSGGQRQRVAMGRAIAREPRLFLMDEPLSNLDAKLRVHMRAEIAQLQREVGVTTLYVTHDQVEAMTMGQRIAVMYKGALQQIGPPKDLYDRPANLFVASFLGSPTMNLLEAVIVRRPEGLTAQLGDHVVPLVDELVKARPALSTYEGKKVAFGFRPEHLRLANGTGPPHLRGAVVVAEALGSEQLAHIDIGVEQIMTEDVADGRVAGVEDFDTVLELKVRRRTTAIVGRFDPEVRLTPGQHVDLWLSETRLHLFDPETGAEIY